MNSGQKGMPAYPVLLVPGSHIAQKGLQTAFLTPQAFEQNHLGSEFCAFCSFPGFTYNELSKTKVTTTNSRKAHYLQHGLSQLVPTPNCCSASGTELI